MTVERESIVAKIVAYTIRTPGHLFPFVPILLELQKRGHNIQLLIPIFRGESPPTVPGVRVRVAQWTAAGLSGGVGLRNQGGAGGPTDSALFGRPLASILERSIAEERPDLLIIDPMLWGGMIVAESSGLPWVSVSHNPKTIRGLGVDARGPGFRPPKGIFGRIWHQVVAVALRADVDRRHLHARNALRAAYGLPPLPHVWDSYRRPMLTIATTAEPFEYPRSDWHPSVRFVGPMLWDPPLKPPRWIKELDGRPLILLVGSSIPEVGKARSWVSIAVEALADESFQVIATLPTGGAPENLPGNVRVERFVPHRYLLPRAVCVVCHGGPGITQKALAAGVPVVAVPFAYDRFEVARRVEVARAGVMLPGSRLTVERLKKAIREAINCKPGAERIAEAFRLAGGAVAAADAVEELLHNTLHGRQLSTTRDKAVATRRR